ncbi:MAG: HIT family protein [Defluviitaleaceae bacterium]|nr:HIT family protein [Defluviitaleaceae bacterium]
MDNCIFCKIIKGDIPSHKIYEDDTFVAILDIFAATKGHVLILPKRHAADMYDLTESEAAGLIPLAKKIAEKINATLSPDGLNVLQNNGKTAGQEVFHYHMHLIPRYNGDGIKFFKSAPQTPQDVLEKLAKELKI